MSKRYIYLLKKKKISRVKILSKSIELIRNRLFIFQAKKNIAWSLLSHILTRWMVHVWKPTKGSYCLLAPPSTTGLPRLLCARVFEVGTPVGINLKTVVLSGFYFFENEVEYIHFQCPTHKHENKGYVISIYLYECRARVYIWVNQTTVPTTSWWSVGIPRIFAAL